VPKNRERVTVADETESATNFFNLLSTRAFLPQDSAPQAFIVKETRQNPVKDYGLPVRLCSNPSGCHTKRLCVPFRALLLAVVSCYLLAKGFMTKLADKKCPPCDQASGALDATAQKRLLKELGKGWDILESHHLEKEFKFKNFVEALDFTNKIGAVAEKMGHHPDIYLTWGKVRVSIFTHSVNGLTENDFVLASKIEEGTRK
jgi:4a-hydroxytetrahydrobiopterin dehydratase